MTNDTIKFCLFLIIISMITYYIHLSTRASEFEVISLQDKNTYKRPNSNILKIQGKIGYTTVVWDNSGGVRISDSCCPNKTCVNMGRTTNSTIICIPNGIMVKPIKTDYDAITQ